MNLYKDLNALEGTQMYEYLMPAYEMASIDRPIEHRSRLLIPVDGEHAPIGAAILIATLAYPECGEKRSDFVRAIAARSIKSGAPPRSELRKEVRKNSSGSWALDYPNKRIQQNISSCERRINKRIRAAWVLYQKLISNTDPSKQSALAKFIIIAAKQNERGRPAFFSTAEDIEDQNEAICDSFRKQVLAESRPVIHIAIALYLHIETGVEKTISLEKLIYSAPEWLKSTLLVAETYRVMFGDMFPRYDSKYSPERAQNFNVPMKETLSLLPFIDVVLPHMDFEWFLNHTTMTQNKK